LTDDGTYKYYYDCENRLIDVDDKATGNPVASYEYDYQGRRVKKTVYGSPDVTTKYCYDGDQVIAEYDGNDTLLRKFVYGPGIDEPVCMIDVADGNKVYYYHFDGLGSVIALTDANGTFIEYYDYDAFGGPAIWDANAMEFIESSIIGNPFMFTARRFDDETGLYYYRARYYEPDIGRFLQTDPIRYAAGLNLYTFVDNNPVNWIDPWGLCKEGSPLDYSKLTTGDWVRELGKGFGEGFKAGAEIAVNEYAFGVTDRLGWTQGGEYVSKYGAVGEASRFAAKVSRDAALAAAGLKGYEKATGIRFELHGTHGGRVPPHIQAIKRLPKNYRGYTKWRFPPH